jgi:hypothetical protein
VLTDLFTALFSTESLRYGSSSRHEPRASKLCPAVVSASVTYIASAAFVPSSAVHRLPRILYGGGGPDRRRDGGSQSQDFSPPGHDSSSIAGYRSIVQCLYVGSARSSITGPLTTTQLPAQCQSTLLPVYIKNTARIEQTPIPVHPTRKPRKQTEKDMQGKTLLHQTPYDHSTSKRGLRVAGGNVRFETLPRMGSVSCGSS